jgi:hypothetical protein
MIAMNKVCGRECYYFIECKLDFGKFFHCQRVVVFTIEVPCSEHNNVLVIGSAFVTVHSLLMHVDYEFRIDNLGL